MSCSCNCAGAGTMFNRRRANQDRRRYERRGPESTTRLLLEEVSPVIRPGDTLLDIGGGIGVLGLELDRRVGLGEVILVDAAPDYVAVARELRGRDPESIRFRAIVGDVTEITPPFHAQVVTLDRVVCCYPDFSTLLRSAASSASRVLALSYPKDRWWTRLISRLVNLLLQLSRRPFRTFVHPERSIHRVLEDAGWRRAEARSTIVWLAERWEARTSTPHS